MVPFIVAGVAIIGGSLVLLFRSDNEESKESVDQSKNIDRNPQVSNFDLDKVRQARKELRYQMRQKKKLAKSSGGNTSDNGEEE